MMATIEIGGPAVLVFLFQGDIKWAAREREYWAAKNESLVQNVAFVLSVLRSHHRPPSYVRHMSDFLLAFVVIAPRRT